MAKMATNKQLERNAILKKSAPGIFFCFFCIGFTMDPTTRNHRKKWSTPSLNIAVRKVSCGRQLWVPSSVHPVLAFLAFFSILPAVFSTPLLPNRTGLMLMFILPCFRKHDRWTNGTTDGRANPHLEMRRRIPKMTKATTIRFYWNVSVNSCNSKTNNDNSDDNYDDAGNKNSNNGNNNESDNDNDSQWHWQLSFNDKVNQQNIPAKINNIPTTSKTSLHQQRWHQHTYK